jgi:ubiquinone/menaquinone biosynthesis C-methylase UbiE
MSRLHANPSQGAAAPVDLKAVDRAVECDRLPEYAETMAAFHRAFATELRAMLADVWTPGANRVLDLACGDGCYSVWLAELAGAVAQVYSVDVDREWLHLARQTAERGEADHQRPIEANALRLPFADNSLDFVWCAQSLYSLHDHDRVLAEVRRTLRPGGRVALLENDSLHQLLLPWDAELELKVRTAELAAIRRRSRRPEKFYVGRELRRRLADAGFHDCHKRTYASNREGPLQGDVRAFVEGYLRSLRSWAKDDLPPADLKAFDELLKRGKNNCWLDDTCMTITTIDYLVWGDK